MLRDEVISRLREARIHGPGPRHGRRGDNDLNPDMETGEVLTAAAVLVPLVERADGLTILLTQRTDHLRDHAGQISFPGGRIEASDASEEAAALREADEEIGLHPGLVELVGRLDVYNTRTGFEVTPIVGLVDPVHTLKPDPFEVADVFEVPLTVVMDATNHERHSAQFRGKLRHYYVLSYENRYIWGATAGMLINLYEVLTGQ